MGFATGGRNRTAAVILALISLTAVILRLIPGQRIIDDAYITYRYARNIVEGIGFVYNPGEPVLGTTTPVYTLLMAAAGWVVGVDAIPGASVVLNAAADGVSVALLVLTARLLFGAWLPAITLGLLWAVSPRSVTFAIGGMETSVYIALMLGAFFAWLKNRTSLAAGLTGLSVLTRPDALLWAGPLGAAMIVDSWAGRKEANPVRRLPWREGAVFAGVLLPWLFYGTATFGSPLTRSIFAKAVAYHLPPTQALVGFMQAYSTPFFEHDTFGPTGVAVGGVVYLALSLFGVLFLFRANPRTLPLSVFPWLHMLAFSLANPLLFRWYTAPAMPMLFLTVVAGVWGLAARALGSHRGRWALTAMGLLWLFTSLHAWTLNPDHGPQRPAPLMAWNKLELLYQEAGQELAPVVRKETVIAAGDIGAIGWYSSARILDTLGLVSPQSSTYYPIDASMLATTGYAVAPDLILDELPDFVVILETYGRNGLLRDPRFLEAYRLWRRIETDIYGSDGMLIFQRK
jgi:hypothetical protein